MPPISKTQRFEVFKRDGFTCQYCGNRPPDVVLEIDHIDPRAGGGTDHEINLVTACFDCNRGKAAKRLGNVRPRPDADIAYLKVQQEMAEAKRYLQASRVLQKLRDRLEARLRDVWAESFEASQVPDSTQWKRWMAVFSAEEIEYAIQRSIQFYQRHNGASTHRLVQYVSGVLWGRRSDQPADSSENQWVG